MLRKINNILRYTTKSILLVLSIIVMFNINTINAKAEEDIITTHIWATTYDDWNHWEYCTLCGEVRNLAAHVYKDVWYQGQESCSAYNYSNRMCDCGYNYVYYKPHGNNLSEIFYH